MKQALRTQMSEKRKTLSPVLYAEKSQSIREKLKNLPDFQTAKRLLIYVSKPEEVETHTLIKEALKENKAVFVPKLKNQQIFICPLHHFEELEPGPHGILEPCEVLEPAQPQAMDLILVPGLAFSSKGDRLGYGGGFYDRLLKECTGKKVGLAFHEQILDEVPVEHHDVTLDLIVTDQSILHP